MVINLAKDIGVIIRDFRKKKQWNQTELANKLGLTQRSISVMENDPTKIDFGIILQVCAALGIRLEINTSSLYKALDKSSTELDW
ncbi:MAG: helix-turn-helix domain-containing protein [Enterobacterales bacterium]|nr:helix-turn-helix domain-containing protein [Enterobacterales bacterium]